MNLGDGDSGYNPNNAITRRIVLIAAKIGFQDPILHVNRTKRVLLIFSAVRCTEE
jgi:hypothetical protein